MTPSRPLRVVRVYHSGVVSAWRRRDRELEQLGADVTLLTARRWNEGGDEVDLQTSDDDRDRVVGLRTLGRHPYLFLYGPIAVLRTLRRYRRADVLDIHEEPASLAAFEIWLLARLVGLTAPFALYCAQNIEKRYPPPFRWIERFLLRRAAAVHTCNDEAGRILRRKGFSGIIENLGLGVDLERFRPGEAAPTDHLRVGYVGRFERHKGVHVLLDALADVPGASLDLIGAGPDQPALEAQIRDADLGDRVHIRGFVAQDELADYYRSIDVLAVPSLDTPGWIEQFGRVAVEAMACGVPVVASASGSLIEVVGDAGALPPPGDARALAAALRSLESCAERERVGAIGVRRARTWSWPAIASRQLDLYRDMLAQEADRMAVRLVTANRTDPSGRPASSTTSPLDLDVVVVSYNSERHLRAALGDLPPCASIRVVDNASADASATVARDAGAIVDESDTNIGFAAGANRGARQGSARFILFLNPDAEIDERSIRRLIAELDADPGLAIVGPSLQDPDGTPQTAAWPLPSPAAAWREALGFGSHLADGYQRRFVIGAALLIRRSVFEDLDGFDERFWLYAEETDLCRRAIDAGWGVGLVADARATHAGGASGIDTAELVAEHFDRGLEHYVAKHHGRSGLASTRAALVIGSTIRSIAPGSPDRRRFHRRRLRRLSAMATTTPLTVPLDNPGTSAPSKGLVVCSLEPWDDVWRRNQFFVRELLARDPNRRVLFVEPPYDRVHERRQPRGRRRLRGLRPLPTDGRIVCFEPTKVWPRVLGPLADRSLRRQVRRAAGALGFDEPDLWVNDPAYAGLATETGWPATYDITDDWTESGESGRANRRVIANEARLVDECGAVVVCSEGLATSRRSLRPDLVVIPNAVDLDAFRRPRDRPADLPPSPVAMYVGTLHEDRLDVDLVEALADRLPDVHVVLVGPNALPSAVSRRLAGRPNVSLLGRRPYADVPAYLQHADVVVIPHVVTPFTESLDPIKAYECLAVGRPTVSTPIAGFRDLGEPVVVADRADFVERVGELVEPRRPSRSTDSASWAERAAQFAGVLASARQAPPAPVRVTYIDHCAQLSGAELGLARLVPELDASTHVVLGEDGPLRTRLEAAHVPVEVLALDRDLARTRRTDVGRRLDPRTVLRTVSATLALRSRLRELDPDVVHTNSLKAALYGAAAARLAGIPVVWHIHDRIADDYLPGPAVSLVRALSLVLPNAIIANSRTTRATLPRRAAVTVIAMPIDAATLEPGPRTPDPDRPFTVAMVGRLAPWKGQDVFVDAFARAFPDGPERAVIVGAAMFGDDDYAELVAARIERHGLTDRIELVGFVDDVPAVLHDVDCLVHASVVPEPFGQVVVEGLAAGLPVIATDAGGPAEILTDGLDGLLVPIGDADALAAAMGRLRTDTALRRRLSVAAIERAADFLPDVVAPQFLAVYRSVARRGIAATTSVARTDPT